MKRIVFSKHADDKLEIVKFSPELRIDRKLIEKALIKVKRGRDDEVMRVICDIDEEHSLVVIYKYVGRQVKVITFFPAKKGRYED